MARFHQVQIAVTNQRVWVNEDQIVAATKSAEGGSHIWLASAVLFPQNPIAARAGSLGGAAREPASDYELVEDITTALSRT